MKLSHRARHWPVVLVIASFVISRVLYRTLLGATFDASPVLHFIQFADIELLRTDLLRTCFSLNHQAPLLNLMAGLALKASPDHYEVPLDLSFMAIGLVTALSLFSLMKRLGVRSSIASVFASIYTATPPVVFYEMWLLYHHIVVCLLTLSMLALLSFQAKKTVGSGIWFFVCLTLIVLTRTTYGLVFMLVGGGLVLAWRTVPWRVVMKAAALPFLFVALYTVRVPILTGRSLGYAIAGPNIAVKIVKWMGPGQFDALVRSGEISTIADEEPFFSLDERPEFRVVTPKTGFPALDNERDSSGADNANCLEYVLIADQYTADAKVLLRKAPDAYLRALSWAFFYGYFRPSTTDVWAPRTAIYRTLAPADRRFERWMGIDHKRVLPVHRFLLPLLLVGSLMRLFRPSSRLPSTRSASAAVSLAVFVIVYASLVSILVAWDDFSRYRFEVDGLYLVLFGLAVDDLVSVVVRLVKRLMKRVRTSNEMTIGSAA